MHTDVFRSEMTGSLGFALKYSARQLKEGDFPGGPVVKTLGFHCRGISSIPGRGTKTPHAVWPKKKKKDS